LIQEVLTSTWSIWSSPVVAAVAAGAAAEEPVVTSPPYKAKTLVAGFRLVDIYPSHQVLYIQSRLVVAVPEEQALTQAEGAETILFLERSPPRAAVVVAITILITDLLVDRAVVEEEVSPTPLMP
jgi:hypothetical protein